MNVHEGITQLCPEALCPNNATHGIEGAVDLGHDIVDLGTSSRAPTEHRSHSLVRGRSSEVSETVAEFTDSIHTSATDQPRLDFAHLVLPHQPWRFTASGQDYDSTGRIPGYFTWIDDWSPLVGRVRHLMQVQMVDQLVGRVVRRLKRLGEWENTTFVVTADHGIAFTTGEPLRSASPANYQEILWTPFFLKKVGQTTGTIEDRPVLSIDLLPTIADTLEIRLPWKVDGHSALGPPATGPSAAPLPITFRRCLRTR